jgi:hypothetical protein
MLFLPVMSIRLQSQGKDIVSVRSRAIMRLRHVSLTTMRLRPASPATTSLAMRATGLGRLFRCGMSVHSVHGNG